jgi:hypothetical protein
MTHIHISVGTNFLGFKSAERLESPSTFIGASQSSGKRVILEGLRTMIGLVHP